MNYCDGVHIFIYNLYIKMFYKVNRFKWYDIHNVMKIKEKYLNKLKYHNL